jgi:glycosyltransferase involved in cell wall biosynthesis
LLAHCDLIYASTPYLAGHLQKLYPTQKVFFGMYAPYMGARIEKAVFPVRESQVFGYMGSKGHQEDLQLVVPAITQLMEERPNLEFEVFGTIQMPHELLRFGDRVRSHKVNQAYTGFLSTLAALNWDAGLAPLVDEPFNLCKAPTKFIEYTAAGIPVVASDVAVYSKVIPEGGGVLVKNDWYEAVGHMLDNREARESALEVAGNYCEKQFSEGILQRQVQHVLTLALGRNI